MDLELESEERNLKRKPRGRKEGGNIRKNKMIFRKLRGVPEFVERGEEREFLKEKRRIQEETKYGITDIETKRSKILTKAREEYGKKRIKESERLGYKLGKGIKGFAAAGMQQPFSQEQEAMNELFGGGDKMWGTNMQPVTMNHALNPRQRGDTSTAELFGFG